MRNGLMAAVLILLLAAGAAVADDTTVRYGAFGGFSMGPQKIDTGDLSKFSSSINQDFSDYQPVLGLHGYAVIAKYLIVGVRGNYIHVDQAGNASDIRITSYDYRGELGVAIFNNDWGLLFPYGGFGRIKHTLDIVDNTSPDIEARFGETKDFRKFGNYAIAGLSYHYPLRITEGDGSGRGFFVGGLHLGATYEVGEEDWQDTDGNTIKKAPEYQFDTFYLLFDIGFGGGV
jgi:Outer membrane protein beta-barrel domain